MRKSAILLAISIMLINSTAYAEVHKEYYESGQLKAETSYKDGKKDGIEKQYYESGQLQGETNFKDDKLEGISKYYHESGQLKAEENYKDGVIVSQKRYDSDGNLESD